MMPQHGSVSNPAHSLPQIKVLVVEGLNVGNPDLARVLRSLTVALHAGYTREGQIILLSPRKS